jgi:small GTP-binding protein
MDGGIPCFKIVIVGAASVGKSSIVGRLIRNEFLENPMTTCGADFYTHMCAAGKETVRLQIWDTAGQERFHAISRSYFRSAVGAILVFSITSMGSFDDLTGWLNELQSLALPNAYVLLIGNKSDLDEEREVGAEAVKEFAERNQLEYLETSARTGNGVSEAFARLAVEVYNRVRKNEIKAVSATKSMGFMELTPSQAEKSRRCC